MLSKIELVIVDYEDYSIIKLHGKMLLGYLANEFQQAVLKAIENKKKVILIDLSELHCTTCWGIGMLMYGYYTAKSAGSSLHLIGVPDNINRELIKVKINKLIKQFESVEDALNER